MTREEAIRRMECCRNFLANNYSDMGEPNFTAFNMAIKALEQETCIQEKQANADKIDAVYIDGFKAGYSQARFDLEQETCEDCISRELALEKMADYVASGYADSAEDFEEYSKIICQLPSVTPARKIGRWVNNQNGTYTCDNCGYKHSRSRYCPNCQAKMEVEERD